MKKIKIMVAEDQKMYREVIKEKIESTSSRIKVIGSAENGKELLSLVKVRPPDIVLLDIYMPEMNGWEALRVLRKNFPEIKIVMFSGEFNQAHVKLAVLEGASAYVDKWKSDETHLIAAIESVYEYGYYFNDLVAAEVVKEIGKNKDVVLANDFSVREIEVIDLICDGMQVKEIAAKLNISNSTVKYHKGSVFKKTKSKTNLDLLKYAIRKGIFNVFTEFNKNPPFLKPKGSFNH